MAKLYSVNLFSKIDFLLDRITMYRLLLYILIVYLCIAIGESLFGIVPFSPFSLILSTTTILASSYASNKILSFIFKAPTNLESVYITALIISLILTPASNIQDALTLALISVIAMGSKYLIKLNKKHIFNPAAIAAVAAFFIINHPASWWVGTPGMFPFVLVGGILLVRKLRYGDIALPFFLTILGISSLLTLVNQADPIRNLNQLVVSSSIIFMGTIMVTEPLTMPGAKRLRMIYAAIIGILTVPQLTIANFYIPPELAIVVGNIFAFLVTPRTKLVLNLSNKTKLTENVWEFSFLPHKMPHFRPGQYMEWTLQHKNPDSRGTRRYFTVASSPTEKEIKLGIKMEERGSSFKKALLSLENHPIVANQLSGGFTLPDDKSKKLVFIAGGIGITPYRSMIKYLIDKNEKRDIILLYTNREEGEIAYKEIFDEASKKQGLKAVYILTQKEKVRRNWEGRIGRIDEDFIREVIPDYKERTFYISGSHQLVQGVRNTLKSMGLTKIKTDYFPGLA